MFLYFGVFWVDGAEDLSSSSLNQRKQKANYCTLCDGCQNFTVSEDVLYLK